MVEFRQAIPVDEAIGRIMEQAVSGQTETVALSEAFGRHLAENVVAGHPVPHFDRSPLDGYAVRAQDTSASAPTRLKVVDAIGAGQMAKRPLQAREAVRIMTGAAIPTGADAVIQLEWVREVREGGEAWVEFDHAFTSGDNVVQRGEDMAEGTILCREGDRIGAGELAVLATFGYGRVKVYRRPRVVVLATGTELLNVDEPLQPGKIRNSNAHMIAGQIRQAGGTCIDRGMLIDDFDLCCGAVEDALREADFVMTTGGVSVGDFDYVPEILRKLGAKVLFNKVAMRPGSVTTVAVKGEQWIFGLSGNPGACFVGFELFARPVLSRALGSRSPHLARSKAVLTADIPKPNPFTRFIRARAQFEGSRIGVGAIGPDKSGIVSSLSAANALIVAPGGTRSFVAGEEMEIIWLKV